MFSHGKQSRILPHARTCKSPSTLLKIQAVTGSASVHKFHQTILQKLRSPHKEALRSDRDVRGYFHRSGFSGQYPLKVPVSLSGEFPGWLSHSWTVRQSPTGSVPGAYHGSAPVPPHLKDRQKSQNGSW